MTTATRTPAQAAAAGGKGRPPASPHMAKASAAGVAARRAQARVFDPLKHCGKKAHQTGQPCLLSKGYGTDHLGTGICKFHGGSSPNGRASARRQKAAASLRALAIPAEGDPLEALQAAVERAHGAMLGAQALLKKKGTLEEADLYMRTIRDAARVAKAAAEAINLDELVQLRKDQAAMLQDALLRTLDRSGMPDTKRIAFLGMFREELRTVLPVGEELS